MNSMLNIIGDIHRKIPFGIIINKFYIILAAFEIKVEYHFVTQFN